MAKKRTNLLEDSIKNTSKEKEEEFKVDDTIFDGLTPKKPKPENTTTRIKTSLIERLKIIAEKKNLKTHQELIEKVLTNFCDQIEKKI